MVVKKRWSMLFIMMICCLLMTGCSEWLSNDYEEEAVVVEEGNVVWEAEEVADLRPGQDDDGEAACSRGERYIDEEGICALPIACNDVVECELWGEQQVELLSNVYGSFVDVEGIELTEEEEALSEEEEEILVTYSIQDHELVLDGQEADEGFYESLWNEFKWIIPEQYRWMITSFAIFSHVDTLAYVVQEDDDWESWSLGINVEQNGTMNEAIGTLTHEFGHLLFLNSNELDPYGDSQSCDTLYMEDTGCLYEASYLYAFKQLFWDDEAGEAEFSEDEFVTEYAASHIDEDMAESWMHFVLDAKPQGDSIAEQKVLFFYEYEELIHLKNEILSRVATLMERAA